MILTGLCFFSQACRLPAFTESIDVFSPCFNGSIHTPTRRISALSEQDFRVHFRRGWNQPDRSGSWIVDPEARIIFDVAEPGESTVILTAKSLPRLDPPLRINVFAGPHRIGTTTLTPDFTDVSFGLPQSDIARGWNVLTITCDRLDRPVDLGINNDSRKLGACVREIRIDSEHPQPSSPTPPQNQMKRLSVGSLAEFFFEHSPGTNVRFTLTTPDESPVNAYIRIEANVTESNRTIPVSSSRSPHTLELRIDTSDLTRVSLVNPGPSEIEFSGHCRLSSGVTSADPAPPASQQEDFSGSILLMVLDACSPEHLGSYGAPGSMTPWIDRFSKHGLQFMNAVSPAPYTISSTASLLTGSYFNRHGIRELTDSLSPDIETFAESLKRRGYYTVVFSSMPTVSRNYGFDRGFDEFHELFRSKENQEISTDEIRTAVLTELPRILKHSPVFIYVHIREPHSPYHPIPAFHKRFDAPSRDYGNPEFLEYADQNPEKIPPDTNLAILNLYRGQIAQADRCLERIHSEVLSLIPSGTPLRTIFLSDHGESFGRHHRYGHNTTLFHDMMAIPMVVRDSGSKHAGITTHLASGLLFKRICSAQRPEQIHIPMIIQRSTGYPSNLIGATDGRYQYIQGGYYPAEMLFDRETDPLELSNRLADYPLRAAQFRSLINREIGEDDRKVPHASHNMSDELKEQLRALGYTI